MSVYLMTVAYNGTGFKGFEKQPNLRTVQGVLEEVVSNILGVKTPIHGSGRTDAGVHAFAQTISFKTAKDIKDIDHFKLAMNRLSPKDIVIKSVEKKSDDFHARHSNCGKVYEYKFHYGERDPFASDEYQFEWPRFNFELFEQAMMLYKGIHNFQNFTVKADDVDGFIRNIQDIAVVVNNNHCVVTLKGNGFMTYMVRMMVGMAFKVATGKMPLESIEKMLNNPIRDFKCYKAPAVGLTLKEVLYVS